MYTASLRYWTYTKNSSLTVFFYLFIFLKCMQSVKINVGLTEKKILQDYIIIIVRVFVS